MVYNDVESLARDRGRAGHYRFPSGIEQFKFYVWAVRGLLVLVVLGTLWYARVESRIDRINQWIIAEEKIDERWAVKHEKQDAYIISNNVANLAVTNSIESIRGRITINEAKISDMELKVNEMWFLKEHGVNFSDELIQKQFREPTPIPKPK